LDATWRIGKFTNLGAILFDTKSTDLNTTFIRGAVSTELAGKKGSWMLGGSMEHNEKKYNATQHWI
jgi:hypothetical protein